MIEILMSKYLAAQAWVDKVWELRDKRVDGWPLMDSYVPTLLMSAAYVFLVTVWGPRFMKDRKPYNISTFLIYYNFAQVLLSAYIFITLFFAGWGGDYSLRCQPVDTSNSPKALLMLHCCYMYYLSKFTEFIDTFCFVARKKFNQVSLLHVVHHGIMPCSVWVGARFLPGGHASFFGLLNTFVHIVMYFYYMMSAMGPEYQKYLWWKQHLTTLQMVQFIGIFTHAFQLAFYEDCGFPWQFSIYIGAHAVMFFILFSQFYIVNYLRGKPTAKKVKDAKNGLVNGVHEINHNEVKDKFA